MAQKLNSTNTRLVIQSETDYNQLPSDFGDSEKAYLIHQSAVEFQRSVEKTQDEANLGSVFASGLVKTVEKKEGSISFTMHPEQLSKLLYLCFGTLSNKKAAPYASVFIHYNGSSNSALIEKSGTNLSAYIGSTGSEALDSSFGTSGTIDLSTSPNNTAAGLVETINAYDDYSAFYVGDGEADTSNISDFSSVGFKGQSKQMDLEDSSATSYVHTITKTNSLKPSFTVGIDKIIKTETYTGCKMGEFSFEAQAASALSGSFNVAGKTFYTDQEFPSGLSFEETSQMIASNLKIYINGVNIPECNSSSVSYNPNLLTDSYELGTDQPSEFSDQNAELTISNEYYYTEDSQPIENLFDLDKEVELIVVMDSVDEVETDKTYKTIFRFPRCGITELTTAIGSSEVLTMPATFNVMQSASDYADVEVQTYCQKEDLTI